jgi:hypothetical protein
VLTTSLRTVAVGFNALGTGTTGVSDSTAIGHGALALATVGNNTAVGSQAGDAITTGEFHVAVGTVALTAMSTGGGCVAVGYGALTADVSGGENTAVGYNAGSTLTLGSANVIIGYDARVASGAAKDGNVVIGRRAESPFNDCICIGRFALSTAANQCVIGSSTSQITDMFVGRGASDGAPTTVTINNTGASGTNIAGAALRLAGGRSTGTGAAGNVSIMTSPSGSSGAVLNALAEAARFDASTTAGQTRFLVYDVDNGTLERVTVGAADSGGVGFKVLRIPN